jgi:RHS repeat-associated protein
VTVAITTPGQNASVTFTGTSGERIAINNNSWGYPNTAVWLNLYNPDGSTAWGSHFWVSGGNFVDTLTLTQSGTYKFSVDPSADATGSLGLTFYAVPADSSGSITIGGDPAMVALSTGQNGSLTFSGTAGQAIDLALSQDSISDSHVSVTNPDGSSLVSGQDFSSAGGAINATLPSTGTYTISVDPQGAASGSMTLTLALQVSGDTLSSGQTLLAGQHLVSSDGAYRAEMQGDGNFVVYNSSNQPIWASGTNNQPGLTLTLGSGGDLALNDNSGNPVWQTYTNPSSNDTLTMQTDGNLVLKDGTGVALWASKGGVTYPDLGSTLNAGSTLQDGQTMWSPTRQYRVTMQTDGNLVIYTAGGSPVWGSGTNPHSGLMLTLQNSGELGIHDNYGTVKWTSYTSPSSEDTLTLQDDGDLVLKEGTGTLLWSSSGAPLPDLGSSLSAGSTVHDNQTMWSPTRQYRATMQTDGNFVVYTAGGSPVWASGTSNHPGVMLTLQTSGDLEVHDNHGAVAWSSGTSPSSNDTLTLQDDGDLVLKDGTGTLLWSSQGGHAAADVGGAFGPIPTGRHRAHRHTRDRRHRQSQRTSSQRRHQHHRVHGHRSHPERAGHSQNNSPRPTRRPEPIGRKTSPLVPAGFAPPYPASWVPGRDNLRGDWRTHRLSSPWASLPALPARSGTPALAGQTLKLNGLPLANASISVENSTARSRTDSSGRFLLQPLKPGHHVLQVDGSTAGVRGRHFASFQIGVDVRRGHETVVPDPIWLPELEPKHAVAVGSPTRHSITLRTPEIPGLQVRIPAGSKVTGANGKPVRHLSVVPVPVDRPPFPLPMGSYFPVYLSVQPAGAYVSGGAQIIYPNYSHLPAGQRVPFWNYDPERRGWYIYGKGTVSANGRHIVPDPSVRIWRLSGAMISGSLIPPWLRDFFKGMIGADPVNLGSGLFTYQKTDLELPDTIPVALTRTYRPGDSNSYSFGTGTTNAYDIRLFSQNNYFSAELVLPDGMRIHYTCIQSCGSSFNGQEMYQAQNTPSEFYGSTINHTNSPQPGWLVRLRTGLSYFFPEFGPLASIRDRFGNQVTITRDGSGNITQVTSPHGRWISFQHDSNNRITQASDNTGRTVYYDYNGQTSPVHCADSSSTGPDGTLRCVHDADGHDTYYTYDATTGWMTKITDARGYPLVSNTYDSNGRVLTQTIGDDPTPYTFSYVLDANGLVTQSTMTTPEGHQTVTNLDSNGFPTSVTVGAGSPAAETTTYQRQPGTNLLTSETNQLLGETTSYDYDSLGNTSKITEDANGTPRVTTMTYDPTYSQPLTVENPSGKVTKYEYDSKGELTSITDPMLNKTTFAYANSDGEPTSTTSPAPFLATTTYDYTLGDRTSVTDPNGNTSHTYLDEGGRLMASTDPDGNTTTYAYDNLNDLTAVTDPKGQTTNLGYNNDGGLTSIQDANQNTTSFDYDETDRLSFRQDALGNQWHYSYDGDGNLKQVQDPKNQTATYTYDPLERLQFAGYTAPNSGSYQSTTDYTYGNTGEDRSVQTADSTGGTLSDTYDQYGELAQETSPNGAINYTYNPDGTRASATVSSQPEVSYGYNDDGLLTSVSNGTQSAALSYDNASRLKQTTLPDGITQNYAYDPASRPTDIIYDNSSGSQIGDLHYALDPDGNRTQQWGSYARLTIPQATPTAVYNADNQLSTVGTTSYTYDNNGNLTGDGTSTYSWNARNQLTSISGGSTASFTYDPFGRREQATIGGKSTSYLSDGQNVTQELSSGTPTVNYLLGPGLGERFARTDSNGTQSYLTDLLGSTIALGNGDQTLATTYTYDPFGQVTAAGDPSTNPYQFAGQQNDGTGLNYDNARYYSPSQGAFTSPDPLGNQTSGVNLYEYANQDPTTTTDPTGLDSSPTGPIACVAKILSGGKDLLWDAGCLTSTGLFAFNPGEAAATDAAALADTVEADAVAAEEEGGAFDLYHGTDTESAANITANGIDRGAASELGGGDKFWTTTSRSDAELFAKANPAGGEPAVVGIRLAGGIEKAVANGIIKPVKGLRGAYTVENWSAFDRIATYAPAG